MEQANDHRKGSVMRYKLIKHEGFEPAVLGMMLSYGKLITGERE